MKKLISISILAAGTLAHAGLYRHVAKPVAKATAKAAVKAEKATVKTAKVAAKGTKAVLY